MTRPPDFTVNTDFTRLGVWLEAGQVVAIRAVTASWSLAPGTALQQAIADQLLAYGQDAANGFDLPLLLRGTAFQKKVWQSLRRIPCGQVRTYGELARSLATSARAVGNACRRNPVLLVVPCHRVVSASGLGGFAGNTTGKWPAIKRKLLAHEGVTFD